ncbi:hypothetical protein MK852_24315 [Shewanella benthica]|nr:hypothetical protein [Shewanella benthica]
MTYSQMGVKKVALWMRSIQLLCSERLHSRRTGKHTSSNFVVCNEGAFQWPSFGHAAKDGGK